jgi:hypothetical protein
MIACRAVFSVPSNADSLMVPFQLKWDDASKGTATDVSYLNVCPAGRNGYIVAKNGHLFESKTGRRIRFLGTNFTFQSDYPNHEDAKLVAAHLAKMGINIVRIHHEDYNGGPLWDSSDGGHTKIEPAGLEKLDYLISQLKANGIYVDLNLHVSRQFVPADGFPESVNSIDGSYDKGIDNLDRHMIDLQKKFAHDYLTHVNPYTHLSYADDPGVAMIEINNENSIVGSFGDNIEAADALPEPFRGELVGAWNNWLWYKYKAPDKLLASWFPPSTRNINGSTDLLSHDSTWTLQDLTKSATLTTVNGGSETGPNDIQVTVPVASADSWHTQALLTGLNLTDGIVYKLSFKAAADPPRELPVYASRDIDDWRGIGLGLSPKIGADWREFEVVFQPSNTLPNHSRISFTLGKDKGSVSISDVRLQTVNADDMQSTGAHFIARTIDIPVSGTKQELADWHHFLADTEAAYATEMRYYLRHDLHVHANVIDTQVDFGSLSSFNREANSDLADNHAYWQHPSFPGKPWDSVDWNISNTPMVDSLAKGGDGTFGALAAYRFAGKPYTITEYNQPAPNDYRAEMFPEFATFAAAQDWDAIFEFDYGSYGASGDIGRVQGFFAMQGDPAKEAFLPSAALIFRAFEFPVFTRTATLILPKPLAFSGGDAVTYWKQLNNAVLPNILDFRMQATTDPGVRQARLIETKASSPEMSTITTKITTSGAEYLAVAEASVAAAGFLGGQDVDLGAADFQFPLFGNNFAALTLASLDGKPLGGATKMLLTVIGKAENQGMLWNDTRTSVGNNWGHAPAIAEVIPAAVSIKTGLSRVWALDPDGHRTKEMPSNNSSGKLNFTIGSGDATVWYEITK